MPQIYKVRYLMSDLKQLVALLDEKAIALQAQFQNLREENGKLKQTIEELRSEKTALQSTITTLKEKNETLAIANRILGSKEHKRETKLKINALIREMTRVLFSSQNNSNGTGRIENQTFSSR